MFDNVGKNLDEEATKRSFASVLIASLILGAGGAFFVGWGAMKVVETVQQAQLDDDAMVEVVMDDPEMDETPPPPPPPPPPPAAADEPDTEEEPDEDAEPERDEMVDEIKELEEKPKEVEVKSQVRPKGVVGGVEGGVEGGELGGVEGGIVGGVVGGELGPLTFIASKDLEVKVRRVPVYPPEAAELHPGTIVCRAEVGIDESGEPFTVTITGCPAIFHGPAKAALMKWRWYPPRVNKKKSRAKTKIAIQFQPPS